MKIMFYNQNERKNMIVYIVIDIDITYVTEFNNTNILYHYKQSSIKTSLID